MSPAALAHDWLFGASFPFWADRALHPRGGFRERLALDGSPIDDDVSRVRVQARQTYVFARAALLGWSPDRARALAAAGVESLLGPCRRRDRLFGRMVRPGIGLADPEPDLYDNAFAVLALAWAARALGAPELLDAADETLGRLDRERRHPSGGYVDAPHRGARRRQNPHMHLFEALLALHAASGAERHLAAAEALLGLFETRFLDLETGLVRELLDDDLAPLEAPVELGHAFEWVALVSWRCRLTGRPPPIYIDSIYRSALAPLDPWGRVPLSVDASGAPVDASRRTWSQTEALRASLARASDGDSMAARRAADQLAAVFQDHLDPAPPGAWIDHYGPDGRPCVDWITAATGYHVVTALAEVMAHPAMQSAQA